MSGYTDQVTRELLALTSNAADVRHLLAEAWTVGYHAGVDDLADKLAQVVVNDAVGNPFTADDRR